MAAASEPGDFPRRGHEVTRLSTFTDAAFAFAAALLAISIDDIPSSYAELTLALKDGPAFVASLAILLLYWRAHQTWSTRFGLEDLGSVLLTFGLVTVVMIYVYPLKIMFGAAFHFMSGGWLPLGFSLNSAQEFRGLLTIYGVGFIALNSLVAGLYFRAWRQRDQLAMSAAEAFDCGAESVAWLIVGSFGLLSIVLAWTLPEHLLSIASWVYMLLIVAGPAIGIAQAKLADARRRR
ncbi:MAG: TMEM175 family protein [Gammaproteobacteria bacterium]|jgi:hypothetical protein